MLIFGLATKYFRFQQFINIEHKKASRGWEAGESGLVMLKGGGGEEDAAHHRCAQFLEVVNHGGEARALGDHVVEDDHLAAIEETAADTNAQPPRIAPSAVPEERAAHGNAAGCATLMGDYMPRSRGERERGARPQDASL